MRANQLSIKEHNIPALKKFIAHLKEINPDECVDCKWLIFPIGNMKSIFFLI